MRTRVMKEIEDDEKKKRDGEGEVKDGKRRARKYEGNGRVKGEKWSVFSS